MAWFICQYKTGPGRPPSGLRRICAMDDFTAQIKASGGDWSEVEALGNMALVKVRATNPVLNTIAAAPGFSRIPVNALDNPLSTLTTNQRQALRQLILDMGYAAAEVQAALGTDVGTHTLREVFLFAAQRRSHFHWEGQNLVADGVLPPARTLDSVDLEVTD